MNKHLKTFYYKHISRYDIRSYHIRMFWTFSFMSVCCRYCFPAQWTDWPHGVTNREALADDRDQTEATFLPLARAAPPWLIFSLGRRLHDAIRAMNHRLVLSFTFSHTPPTLKTAKWTKEAKLCENCAPVDTFHLIEPGTESANKEIDVRAWEPAVTCRVLREERLRKRVSYSRYGVNVTQGSGPVTPTAGGGNKESDSSSAFREFGRAGS